MPCAASASTVLPSGRHEHRRHQAERAEALRDGVGLHVAVVVLAGPDVAALPLHRRGDHVVDEAVLVGEPGGLELGLELGLEDLREEVLEAAVVGLEDRVLRGQVDRVAAVEAVAQRRAREVADGVVEVVHAHRDAAAGEVEDVELDRLAAVVGRERHRQLAGAGHLEVGGAVLVAERVTADDDRLGPARHQPRDVRDDDRLAEDDAAEDVADRAVGRLPHLLQAELLDPGLVGRDGRALHADAVLLDGVGGVDRHLVVGGVAVLDAEVVVVQVDVEVREDQLVLDELPDDPGHLVAVELDDRVVDLDLRHGVSCASRAVGRAGLDQAELGDGVALLDQLGDGGVDARAGEVVDLQALDDLPLAAAGDDGERGDDALGHAVRAVGRERRGGPVALGGAVDPRVDVVDGGVGGRCRRRRHRAPR